VLFEVASLTAVGALARGITGCARLIHELGEGTQLHLVLDVSATAALFALLKAVHARLRECHAHVLGHATVSFLEGYVYSVVVIFSLWRAVHATEHGLRARRIMSERYA
jgi:fumarate reductase subunit D